MSRTKLKLLVVGSLAVGIVGFAAPEAQPPTKGRVPDEAFEGGRLNLDVVPDYFLVYARNGEIAGYIRKADYFVSDGPRPKRIEVVDEALASAVGHMVAGRGFVPLGTPDEAIPEFSTRPTE